MDALLKISGETPENKNIQPLADAVVSIIQAGGDREVTVKALETFGGATQVHNTISNCTFTNRVEKE